MYYFLAFFPKIDFTQINVLRRKYDPNFAFIDPHVAVFFPVDASIGEGNLISHIEKSIEETSSFTLTFKGLKKSWDHYLYLTVDDGKNEVIMLHDTLYSGALSPYLLKNVPYIPHLTLGFFADRQAKFDMSDLDQVFFDKKKFDLALKEATDMNFHFQTTLDNFTLISREDKTSPAVIVKEFLFSKR